MPAPVISFGEPTTVHMIDVLADRFDFPPWDSPAARRGLVLHEILDYMAHIGAATGMPVPRPHPDYHEFVTEAAAALERAQRAGEPEVIDLVRGA